MKLRTHEAIEFYKELGKVYAVTRTKIKEPNMNLKPSK